MDDVINIFLVSLLWKTDRFHVAVRLFSNRSQMMSNVVRTKKVAHELLDVFCDLLLNGRTATWNLFVNKETKDVNDLTYTSVLQ